MCMQYLHVFVVCLFSMVICCAIFAVFSNRDSLTVVERYFPQYALQDQAVLGLQESVDKVLALVPEDILCDRFDSTYCDSIA